mgnify:CR=1 FL=1
MNNLSLSVFMPVIISFLISVVFCPILIPSVYAGLSGNLGKYFADLLNLYWQIYGNSSRFIYDTWFWSDWFSG